MKKLSCSTAFAAMLLAVSTGALTLAPVIFTPSAAHADDQLNVGQMLKSLRQVDVENFNIYTDFKNILDARYILKENQIEELAAAIQDDPIALANSEALTELLQGFGFAQNQIVVGFINGIVYVQDISSNN